MDNTFSIFSLPDEVMVEIFNLSIEKEDPTKLGRVSKEFTRIFNENFAYQLFLDYRHQPHLKDLADKINTDHQDKNSIQKVAILYTTLIGMTNQVSNGESMKRESFAHYKNAIDPSRLDELAEKLEEEIAREETLFFSQAIDKTIQGFQLLTKEEREEMDKKLGTNEGAKEVFKAKKYREWIDAHPEEIRGIQKIEIDFGGSYEVIPRIPKEIGKFIELKTLKINGSGMKRVPSEIGPLKNLEVLHLDDNQITDIPSEIGDLRALRNLTLSNNHIENLPSEIGKLTSLEYLLINNNPLSEDALHLLSEMKVKNLKK